jgi:transposase
MNKKKAEQIIRERAVSGSSLRILAKKYGLSASTIYRMVNKDELIDKALRSDKTELPDDVKQLKELLRKERLKTELLNNIIDIADKELGTNIRKKSGTRRSE